MDWSALIFGIGGLFLGAFTTYLSYRQQKNDRTSKYKEALYTKQIEMISEIMKFVSEYFQLVRDIIEGRIPAEKSKETIEKALMMGKKFSQIHGLFIVFMTNRIHKALNSFSEVTRSSLETILSDLKQTNQSEKLSKMDEMHEEIRLSYYELIDAMREAMGTESLSQDRIKVTGGF